MAVKNAGSIVARRRLGNALRELREQANLRLDAAAYGIECSSAKLSRLENGLGVARDADVDALLDLYENALRKIRYRDPGLRARFAHLVHQTKSARWWEPVDDLVDDDEDRFLATETESARLRSYCATVIPPVLQTEDYARAHIRAQRPELGETGVQQLVELRRARGQAFLEEPRRVGLTAIVDESAILRHVGSPDILKTQLRWLTGVLDRHAPSAKGGVAFRILPFSAGAAGTAATSFTIFDPRQPRFDPTVCYVEGIGGGTWREDAADVALIETVFSNLTSNSLDPEGSQEVLCKIIDG
jgi:hypothetical protein